MPEGNSNIEYSRARALFNYPIKLRGKNAFILLGLDYSNINLSLEANASFDRDLVDGFQLLDLNIGYTRLLRNDWRLGARIIPGVSSNRPLGELSFNDLVLSGDIVFIKDKKNQSNGKPWRLILGVSYGGNRGIPFPLPFISYYRKFNPQWSYNLGIPKTNLQYHISKTHRVKLFAQIDGFSSKLKNGVLIDGNQIASRINMFLLLGGLQYEYHLTKIIRLYGNAAYIMDMNLDLRDGKRNDLKNIESSNSAYLRLGVRLKI